MAVANNIAEAVPVSGRLAAPSATEPVDFQTGRVVIITAGHFIHDCYTAFLAPMLIVFRQTLGLSNEAAGFLSVITQQGSLIQPLIGGAADRYGARWFIILAPAITGGIMSLLGLATSYWTLAIFMTVVGLSSACLHAVGPVMIGKLSGKRLGAGMSIWMVGGEAGRFVGPLVLAGALPVLTMKHTPWLMIGGLITGLLLFFTMTDVSSSTAHAATRITIVARRDPRQRKARDNAGFRDCHHCVRERCPVHLPAVAAQWRRRVIPDGDHLLLRLPGGRYAGSAHGWDAQRPAGSGARCCCAPCSRPHFSCLSFWPCSPARRA